LRTRAIPQRFWGDDSQRDAMSSVRTFTFTFTGMIHHFHTDYIDISSRAGTDEKNLID